MSCPQCLNDAKRCHEAKIEESEKAGRCQESNPGHLGLSRHIEDCEGWWLSSYHNSVEHWRLAHPRGVLGLTPHNI